MSLRNTVGNKMLTFNNKRKPLNEVVEKRNKRLISLFKEWQSMTGYDEFDDCDSIRLFGDSQNPAIIYKNNTLLACYAKNFDLILLDKNDNGEQMFSIKLTQEIDNDKIFGYLNEWFIKAAHKKVYTIALRGSNLHVNGYHHFDQENRTGDRYPIFADKFPRIYIKLEYAEGIIDEFKGRYDLILDPLV